MFNLDFPSPVAPARARKSGTQKQVAFQSKSRIVLSPVEEKESLNRLIWLLNRLPETLGAIGAKLQCKRPA